MIKLIYPEGATPLDLDEIEELIPQHIHLQSELNEWEQTNILHAENGLAKHHFSTTDILNIDFIKTLHKKMFDKTWKWAGKFRKTGKNIGADSHHISEKLKILLDDIQYQLNNKTYPINEIATRFHHRLVSIHPFSNGNGRHARLTTDLLLIASKHPRFTWGRNIHTNAHRVRQAYIHALKAADHGHYEPLLRFVLE